MSQPIRDRVFPIDPSDLLPAITPDTEKYWASLAEGMMVLQHCSTCERLRHPVTPACPYCQSSDWSWRPVSGRGQVFSWVRYHRSYLPEFADLMPYVVLTVQLDEGPRIFGRLVDEGIEPQIGMAVSMVIERWPEGRCVPAFSASQEE